MNVITLVGRTTKDVDLRYTSSGKAVGTFNIAVNRQFKGSSGEKEVDFINCVIWDKSAENFANFVRKGYQVAINGRLQVRTYENNNGEKVWVTEVVVTNFTLLAQKNSDTSDIGNNQHNYPNNNQNSYNQSQNNFKDYRSNDEDPFLSSGQSIDISDDDLPF